jgi:hypothetical protein
MTIAVTRPGKRDASWVGPAPKAKPRTSGGEFCPVRWRADIHDLHTSFPPPPLSLSIEHGRMYRYRYRYKCNAAALDGSVLSGSGSKQESIWTELYYAVHRMNA